MIIIFMLLLVFVAIVGASINSQRATSAPSASDDRARGSAPKVTMTVSIGGPSAITGTPSTSRECWLPPGTETRAAGRAIGGGFVYVGTNLPSVSEWRGVEPALIDPALPRNDRQPDRAGEGLSYWPDYTSIPVASRSAYLDWLASGRLDPDAAIGYVFLYFYGLERRALHDAKTLPEAKAEVPRIVDEVHRLCTIYGEDPSFRRYAGQLLEFLTVTEEGWQPAEEPPLYDVAHSWFGTGFKFGVGRMALAGEPLPVEWALAWAKQDPNISFRTPARRCQEEFVDLFRILYRRRFDDGLRIKACKRTVTAEYRPASPSFDRAISSKTTVPDVTSLVGPSRKIRRIVDSCCEALDAYSRWIGRNPEGRRTLRAAAFLPPELLATRAPRAFDELREELVRRASAPKGTLLPARVVFRHWLSDGKDKLTKKDTVEAASLFGHAGFAFEPDVRFGGPRIASGDPVIVFPLEESEHNTPSADYAAAAILLHLASLVAASDGQVSPDERACLRDHIAEGLHLDQAERTRLGVHLAWLLAKPPTTPGGKRRLEKLTPDQKRSLGELLIAVAWADGRVEPTEVKILTRIFRLLDLDPGIVHQWLHSHQTSPDPGPVAVTSGGGEAPGFALPRSPESRSGDPESSSGIRLDMAAIAAKLEESERAATTLASIFVEDDETLSEDGAAEIASRPVCDLDASHSALLRQLARQATWLRSDYDELAESLGLLPDGALDLFNEAAFELCDEALIEGEDPLEVNLDVAQEMTA